MKLEDLQSPEKLLTALTPEILDQTAKLLGIRVEWLEGAADQVYDTRWCGKEPKPFLEHVAFLYQHLELPRFMIRVLTTRKKLDRHDPSEQILLPVLLEKIAQLGDEEIYRYHLYCDAFNWSHELSRIQLKAMMKAACKYVVPVIPLFAVSESRMEDLLAGRIIPRQYLKGVCITSPSLEDYFETKEETVQAKETDELPAVMDYIEQHGLKNLTFTPAPFPVIETHDPTAKEPDNATDENIPRKPTGKRAEAQAQLWEPVRAAAKTLWAKDGTLSIAAVIKEIKGMPVFKASALSESAIRKHINDLAPPGANKPGRKRNKST